MENLVKFTGQRCSRGYEIKSLPAACHPSEYGLLLAQPLFECFGESGEVSWIVPRGCGVEALTRSIPIPIQSAYTEVELVVESRKLYIDLANARDDAQLIEFTSEWGPLFQTSIRLRDHCTPLAAYRIAQQTFAEALTDRRERSLKRLSALCGHRLPRATGDPLLGQLDILFRPIKRRWQVYFETRVLVEFCAIQFALDQMAGTVFATCDVCGKFLHRDRVGRRARHCGNACRVAAWRRAHPEGVARINERRREKRSGPDANGSTDP